MTKVNPKGKIVFVSGANRGIGKETVIELIEKGAKKVYAASRKVEALQELVDQFGDKVVPVELDLTNSASIQAAAKSVGDIDILINNAGVLIGGYSSAENSLETLKQNFQVNVFGLIELTQAFSKSFEKASETAIVNLSSLAGLANMPVIGTYSVSKAAVHSISQGLRAEYKDKNTLVACVYPGAIDTEMTKQMDMPKDTPKNVAKYIVAALIEGVEDVFPDQMSAQAGPGFLANPKAIEGEFAKFM